MGESLEVWVVYALPDAAIERRYELPAGATLAAVLALASRDPALASIALVAPVAIFGRRVHADEPLRTGDRVELLRALENDPKEARRRRVSRFGGS